MTLVTTRELLDGAVAAGRGLAALNVIHLESAEAIAAAAEETGQGVVLQISQNCVRYHGSLARIAAAARAVAETSSAPLSLHLDHAEDADLVDEALAGGLSSVMYDGSSLPYPQNVATTRAIVEAAAAHEVLVEAELGEVGGKDGVHAPGVRTDPAEAARFVSETGVHALAVAVGSSHAMTTKSAEVDVELVGRLAAAVPVPLVLHGSSGVPEANLAAAIRAGMRKVNVSTQLVDAFTAAVRRRLTEDPHLVDSRKYLRAGREALTAEAIAVIRLVTTAARPAGPGAPR
ncbi:class II fructose-bisphosphate aldolase [Georgenia deserti]|uniref:Class II fructose-bisphosphate aldolase n=1 Tax=Georgenia deserti TaxID=2093781 RepID=A0ABW4L2U1_9MICO